MFYIDIYGTQFTVSKAKVDLKLCTHDQDLRIRKFCIYANFAYVSKSIFYFAFTWPLRINRICRKLKFYSIKVIVISLNSENA